MARHQEQQPNLSADRVVRAAVDLADAAGLDAVTMRTLAAELGTSPMSIYHHLRSKEEIIDGMVEFVYSEIELPDAHETWANATRIRCRSAHETLIRHKWAAPLMQSRTPPGPLNLRHHDAMIAHLKRGGLPLDVIAHAYASLDAFVYGFSAMEAAFAGRTDRTAVGTGMDGRVGRPWFTEAFEFGLDLLVEGYEGFVSQPDV